MAENPESTGRTKVDAWFTTDERFRLAAGLGILIAIFEFAISLIDLVTEVIIHSLVLGIGFYAALTVVEYLRVELATE